jgi:circadian clock protein KaiC
MLLHGGLPRNRVYLVMGDPGTGKTTFGIQFLLEGVRNGEQALYITLAETKAELLGIAQSHGFDLSRIAIHEVSVAAEQDRPEQDYTALLPAEIELGESLDKIVETIEKVKPRRVVIDSLTEIRLLAREAVRYRRQIIALKNFLMKCSCTVLFIDDPAGRGPDGQLLTICHGAISFERMAPEYGPERRRMQILKMRGVEFYGGYHDYNIRKGGLVIWPRLIAAEHQREYHHDPVPSGVPELDSIFGGGPDRGTTLLAVGAAGVGKSSLCQQYCMAASQRGEYFAWFSFDERLDTVYKRGRAMGLDFGGLVEAGRCSVEQVDPAALSPGEFIQRVRRQVERFNARIVVLDSLNGYLNAMPGERYLTIQMHELLTYLARMGVLSMIVVAQHGLVGAQLDPPIDMSYLADCVAYLRYFEHAGEVRRALSVVKKRGARHEMTIRELTITGSGVRVGQPLRQFQGVLAGEPRYIGETTPLLAGGNGNGGGGA